MTMSKSYLFAVVLGAGSMMGVGASGAIISPSPTLPLLGVPFVVSGGGSCFPTAGVCFVPGTLTFTSVVPAPPAPPPFNVAGEDILTNAIFTGQLTTLSSLPLGLVTLTGTIEQEVLGRTFSTETGSWAVDLLAVDLTGPVLGHTLTMHLDGTTPSTGIASITPAGGPGDESSFLVSSSFDVFLDLSLDQTPPLHATREAHLDLAVPEPASLGLLTASLFGLTAVRRGRRR